MVVAFSSAVTMINYILYPHPRWKACRWWTNGFSVEPLLPKFHTFCFLFTFLASYY